MGIASPVITDVTDIVIEQMVRFPLTLVGWDFTDFITTPQQEQY